MTVNYLSTVYAVIVSAPLEADFDKAERSECRLGEPSGAAKVFANGKNGAEFKLGEPSIIQDGEVARSAKGGLNNKTLRKMAQNRLGSAPNNVKRTGINSGIYLKESLFRRCQNVFCCI